MKYKFSDNHKVNHTLNLVVENLSHLAEEQLAHIKQLTLIGKSLSSETELHRIFDLILEEGISFTKADAATIYMLNEEQDALNFEIVFNATLGMRLSNAREKITWPAIRLFDEQGRPKLNHIVSAVYHNKESLEFEDVYEAENQGFDISGTRRSDSQNNYRCKSMVTIPLKNHEEEVLGVMQFINALDNDKNIISFSEEHLAMLTSLASQAAISLSNRKLIESLEELLMQFIRSIAVAIERKSKYSSNHILRVARLTEEIADRINEADSGHFARINFDNHQLKELSMAGWMHDMGKIITPEFVMDKSRKLERIMDGAAIVKERFKKLKLLLRYLKLKLSEFELNTFIHENISPNTDAHTFEEYLDGELSFIEELNQGQEYVQDHSIARMYALKAVDFEYEGEHYYLLDETDKLNLSIRRGTLNDDEFKEMRAHAMITWEMLSQLTFPKKYKNVAFYAASHHEALDGSGYPKGLKAQDLPLQARIIAVADIFEALTAADRPYKTPKTLSESLKIMAIMVKNGHLDRHLVDLFMDSGLYLEFAQNNLRPEQIDTVDIPALKAIYQLG